MKSTHIIASILAFGLATAAPAQNVTLAASADHKGWINILSVDHGGHVPGSSASASVTFVRRLTGLTAPRRVEFEVESGPLQRKLARTHQERNAVDVEVRGWDLERKQQVIWKLKSAVVSSYQAAGSGSASVVIETGPVAGSLAAPARSN